MALPPVLSEKGLAKFRTKLCERLLATGSCAFGDKCQYSHTDRPRRNPHKVHYVPRLCVSYDNCPNGADCGFAHTRDEELFHPSVYKTSACPGTAACNGYYCPYAHSSEELRSREGGNAGSSGGSGGARPATARAFKSSAPLRSTGPRIEGGTGGTPCVEVDSPSAHAEEQDVSSRSKVAKMGLTEGARRSARSGRGTRGASSKNSQPQQVPSASASNEGNAGGSGTSDRKSPEQATLEAAAEDPESTWWYAGDQGDLRVCVKEVVSAQASDGDALVGGIIRPGLITLKTDSSFRSPEQEVSCKVKLMTISRGDSQIAAQVVKEAKRWIHHWSNMEQGHNGANHSQHAYVLRRTVATTVLALPEFPSTLGQSMLKLDRSVAQGAGVFYPLVALAASWARQLVTQVQALHSENISHLCLGPQTVIVNASGDLHIGDFMGKIRALRLFESGWRGKTDDAWAMWYPPEVHRCVSAGDGGGKLDKFRIDSWQLGVAIFYLLTGEHPFGNRRKPSAVCANVVADRRVNRPLLDHLPLFADLISRLTERCPEQRLLPVQVVCHPVLWSMAEALRFAAPLLMPENTLSWPAQGTLFWACLQHIPALSVLGGPTPPADVPGCLEALGKLCDKAISTNSVPVISGNIPTIGRLALSAPAQHSPVTASAAHAAQVAAQPPVLSTLPGGEPGLPAENPNWQGSAAAIQTPAPDLLRAPPGLEGFTDHMQSQALAAAMPCHPDSLAFGAQTNMSTQPATAPSAAAVAAAAAAAVAPGLQLTIPPPVASSQLSLSELELLSLTGRTQALPPAAVATSLAVSGGLNPALAPSAPLLTDPQYNHPPTGILATGQPHREADGMLLARAGVTGLAESTLGLVHAVGHEASSRAHPLGLHNWHPAYNLQASHGAAFSAMHGAATCGSMPSNFAAAAGGAHIVHGSHGMNVLGGVMASNGGPPYLELPQYLQNLGRMDRNALGQPHALSTGHPSVHGCSHSIYNHLGLLTGFDSGALDPAAMLTGVGQPPHASVPVGYLPPALAPTLPPTAAASAAIPPPASPAPWLQGQGLQPVSSTAPPASLPCGTTVKASEVAPATGSQWPMRVEADPVAGGTRAVLTIEPGYPMEAPEEQSLEAVEAKLERFLSAWENAAEAEEKEDAEKLAKGVGGDGVSCLPADLLCAMEGAQKT